MSFKRGEIYPTWLYHKTLAPKLVKNAKEDAELGPEWGTPEDIAHNGHAIDFEADVDVEVMLDQTPGDDLPKKRGRKPKGA